MAFVVEQSDFILWNLKVCAAGWKFLNISFFGARGEFEENFLQKNFHLLSHFFVPFPGKDPELEL